jgi:ABC-type nitrate/sulfonate/bicarbonate transport system substrate-binding protein
MRDFAEKNQDLMKRFMAVVSDLSKAIEERPNEVKAAVVKLFPDLDAATIDLLYGLESPAWKTKPVTVKDVAHEIQFLKSGGVQLPPDVDKMDLASLLLQQ